MSCTAEAAARRCAGTPGFRVQGAGCSGGYTSCAQQQQRRVGVQRHQGLGCRVRGAGQGARVVQRQQRRAGVQGHQGLGSMVQGAGQGARVVQRQQRRAGVQGHQGLGSMVQGAGQGARVVQRQQRRAGVQGHQRHVAQAPRHGVVAHVDEVAQDHIRVERLRAAWPA